MSDAGNGAREGCAGAADSTNAGDRDDRRAVTRQCRLFGFAERRRGGKDDAGRSFRNAARGQLYGGKCAENDDYENDEERRAGRETLIVIVHEPSLMPGALEVAGQPTLVLLLGSKNQGGRLRRRGVRLTIERVVASKARSARSRRGLQSSAYWSRSTCRQPSRG